MGNQSDAETVRCENCGKEMDSRFNFCTECGSKLYDLLLCPFCRNRVDIDDNFCGMCGKALQNAGTRTAGTKRYTTASNTPLAIAKYPEPLSVAGTDKTPEIILDRENGIFEFSGKSVPEDAAKFYEPILSWIDGYVQEQPAGTTFVTFKMSYFNTTTSKIILGIVQKLAKIKKEVRIDWYYAEEDEEMQEYGEVLEEITRLRFEMHPVPYEE